MAMTGNMFRPKNGKGIQPTEIYIYSFMPTNTGVDQQEQMFSRSKEAKQGGLDLNR